MKEIKYYICEFCGTKYSDKNNCIQCEEGHNVPKSIDGAAYFSIKCDGSGYPSRVHIKMSNGETITYKRY